MQYILKTPGLFVNVRQRFLLMRLDEKEGHAWFVLESNESACATLLVHTHK